LNNQDLSGMRLLGKQILDDFSRKHTDAMDWIANWVSDVEGSVWKTSQDIKKKYPRASFLSDNIVIFDVKGNNYRLEVKISYNTAIVLAIWVGTHAEYDRRNKKR
jgi:mRNA interferase HigB